MLFGLGADLRLPALINFVSFLLIGIPSGAALAYSSHLGAEGIWAGLLLAMSLIVIGQYSYLLGVIDWMAPRPAGCGGPQ